MPDRQPERELSAEDRNWERRRRTAAQSATPASVEYALFARLGLSEVAGRVWQESLQVSDRARRRVGQLLRARYGIRSPKGGLVPIVVLILVFAMVAPLAMLGFGRGAHNVDPLPEAGALCTAIIGLAMFVASLLTIGRPVPRPTSYQAQVAGVLLGGWALTWIAWPGDAGPSVTPLLLAGIAGLVLAVIVFAIGRHRDPAATAELDAAESDARRLVLADLAVERASLRAELERVFAERGDRAEVVRMRDDMLEHVTPATGTGEQPPADAVPGWHMVSERTSDWLPKQWPPARASAVTRSGSAASAADRTDRNSNAQPANDQTSNDGTSDG
ncbi:hypothetical protein [Agromyces sp. LHK192]|uniref:hypothetical protein n=1 Tax=Agromyces sp. LHK192 TaxID=2498704 RepID=UPI000FD81A49|nr:hypothetical protein [Agromyces sp. LHK192]